MNVLVNSDDYGKNHNVNVAVVKSFQNGLCNSATLMVNSKGFDEAVELAYQNKLNNYNMGLHLVLTEGKPLTDKIRFMNKFCNEYGEFCYSRNVNHLFYLNTSEKEALSNEIMAQIHKYKSTKLKLTHIDSHHHVHVELALFMNVILPVIKQEGIRYIRLARNIGNNINIIKRIYKSYINKIIVLNKMSYVDYFGAIEDFTDALNYNRFKEDQQIEIMIHPEIYNGRLVNVGSTICNMALDEQLKDTLKYVNQQFFRF